MIRIVTDSAADIETGAYDDLEIMPLKVNIDGKTYLDGVDMSKDEFFEMLENSDVLPSTSLASPYEFMSLYEEITKAGDEAIVIPVSSALSGTYQSAVIGSEGFDNISVIDSCAVSLGQALLVRYALDLVKEGLSRKEIVEKLEEGKKKIVFYAVVDTLEYLQKGGRLSKGAALLGGLIGLKPILAIEDGSLAAIGKARGSKAAYRKITEMMENDDIDLSHPIIVAYSGTSTEKMDRYLDDNKEFYSRFDRLETAQLGTAVGTHAGPGTIVMTYFVK